MQQAALLVSTFDGYSECWQPFWHGLQKYWPGCPYDLYFITNFKDGPGGTTIKVGKDRGWAVNLKKALQQIEAEFIIYAQEDYWINQPVNQTNIEDYVSLMTKEPVHYIRLHPVPGPDEHYPPDGRLGAISPQAEYRTSLQMALWRKSILNDLVLPDESPWAFERYSSQRTQLHTANQFLSVTKRGYGVNYVFTALVDGRWTKAARTYVQQEGLSVDFSNLPRKSWKKRTIGRIRSTAYGIKRRTLRTMKIKP